MAGNERNTAHGLYKDLERLAVLSTCMEELENGAAEDSIAWDATATNAAPLLEQADDFLASLDASNPPVRRRLAGNADIFLAFMPAGSTRSPSLCARRQEPLTKRRLARPSRSAPTSILPSACGTLSKVRPGIVTRWPLPCTAPL